MILMVSVCMRFYPSPRGQRILTVLYSELVRRYERFSKLAGSTGNPHRK